MQVIEASELGPIIDDDVILPPVPECFANFLSQSHDKPALLLRAEDQPSIFWGGLNHISAHLFLVQSSTRVLRPSRDCFARGTNILVL